MNRLSLNKFYEGDQKTGYPKLSCVPQQQFYKEISHISLEDPSLTGLIIVFEGLPGCGKSTIAREAVKRLENTVLMPEVSEMAASRGFEVADRASIGTETWFLTQYYTRGAEAKRLRNEGKHVIMDRNYASSIAFGFANFVATSNPSLFMHFPSYIVNKAV